MRRVVVTGMGIVSSIGNNVDEVLESLREARPGIVFAPEYAAARLPLPGPRRADARSVRGARPPHHPLHGQGRGLELHRHAAGDRRCRASRRATSRIRAPASSWARAAPRPAPSSKPPTSPARKGPKRIGPLAVPKAMSSTASATLATPSASRASTTRSSSACATSKHCIGNGYEQIQLGKQDIVFAGGHEDLDWTLSNLFDAMGAMSLRLQRHAREGLARLRPRPRRLRHRRRRRRAGARGTRARQGARRQDPRRARRLRRDLRRLRHGRALRRRRRALHAHGARRRSSGRSTTSTRTPPRRRSATRRRWTRSAPSSASATSARRSRPPSRSPAIRWAPPACRNRSTAS